MKTFKFILFATFVALFISCGGNDKKANVSKEDIIGKWQPENLEFKDIPAYLKKQMEQENLEKLLTEEQKTGYLELNADSTFVMKDTKNEEGMSGKWSFDGKTIKLSVPQLEIGLSFYVESVSKDKLEIDYASMYKAMAGLDKIPFFDVKMIMTYKRIK